MDSRIQNTTKVQISLIKDFKRTERKNLLLKTSSKYELSSKKDAEYNRMIQEFEKEERAGIKHSSYKSAEEITKAILSSSEKNKAS